MTKSSFEPVSTELVEINGVPTLTKTFELAPDIDPALLREEPFSQDGYWYRYQRMDKADQEMTDTQQAEETVTVDAPSGELADVIGQFPATAGVQQGRLHRRTAAGRAEHQGGGDWVQHGARTATRIPSPKRMSWPTMTAALCRRLCRQTG